jgi:Transglutaminase-like superfamily
LSTLASRPRVLRLRGLVRARDRLRALRELNSPRESALLASICAFAATVPLLMRLPLPRLGALVTRPPRRRHASPADVERLAELVELAPRVGHPLVRRGCVPRGVTLFWFLRRAGLDVELRFGLDPASDGHCWLALNGEPFLEKVDPRPRFTELYRLPRAGA